jgi:hypothetical protein
VQVAVAVAAERQLLSAMETKAVDATITAVLLLAVLAE